MQDVLAHDRPGRLLVLAANRTLRDVELPIPGAAVREEQLPRLLRAVELAQVERVVLEERQHERTYRDALAWAIVTVLGSEGGPIEIQ